MKKVRITKVPKLQDGGMQYTQWRDFPDDSTTPGYQDYGANYTVPGWPGLLQHTPGNQNWGMGNDANLMQPNYAGFSGNTPATGTGYDTPRTSGAAEGSENYSIDAVRMKYGGAKQGTYNQFDAHSWDIYGNEGDRAQYGSKPNPYAHTKKTLPQVDEEDMGPSTIEAEKQEKVLGNFTPDGLPALMNVSGKPHTEGGKKVNVPDGSFVFSDTKSLKIKNPDILKLFGATKASTPAKLATKYDLQKFTKQLADPSTDEVSRRTAEVMVDNYTTKLNQLASVQESLKAAKFGKENPQMSPQFQKGGPIVAHEFDEQGRMSFVPVNNSDKKRVRISGIPKVTQQDWIATDNIAQPFVKVDNPATVPYYLPHEQIASIHIPDRDLIDEYKPVTVPQPTNMQATDKGSNDTSKEGDNFASNGPRFTAPTPDKWATANSLLNLATINKYPPWEAPIGVVAPDVTFLDPTRALAANSEAANSQSYNAMLSGNARAARASGSAIQGQAASNAANILGQYANQNTEISNRANELYANLSNQLQREQTARANRLYQGNVIANQQYDNAIREGRGDLLRTMEQSWKDRQAYDLMNKTSPYYYIDPVTGARQFKSKETEAAFWNNLQGGHSTGSNEYTQLAREKEKALAEGLDEDEARRAAWKAVYGESISTTYDKSGNVKSTTKKTGPKVTKYGGYSQNALRKFTM